MRFAEKLVVSLVAIVLCFGAFSYAKDFGMYEAVEDYSMVTGYATLASKLQDREWVEETQDTWSSTNSTLSRLWYYVTDQSDDSPVADINEARVLNTICLVVSMASVPLYIVSAVFGADYKQLRRNRKHG